MPILKVGDRSFAVEEGTKLVLALEDHGVDILHRCGGNARCTTCRVEVLEGDLGPIGEAEAGIRNAKGITDDHIRLSCQVRVVADVAVKPLMTVSETGMDPGQRPQA
ncbi:(2Fe-2S)-binding protein [Paenibacillus antri]|uniref:(2Fe-2S)-binding protein n=1 Tax=Paenibacillus antri TaxID=2582848 RepID=A0A5R9G5Q0_9BACL|nr:2Fe-2S iron-sulfur cluster-binding protein [Paenibacillus antri]TLS51697.1 (2Fe-2S)-binding protein [Paenibacillus antri]